MQWFWHHKFSNGQCANMPNKLHRWKHDRSKKQHRLTQELVHLRSCLRPLVFQWLMGYKHMIRESTCVPYDAQVGCKQNCSKTKSARAACSHCLTFFLQVYCICSKLMIPFRQEWLGNPLAFGASCLNPTFPNLTYLHQPLGDYQDPKISATYFH